MLPWHHAGFRQHAARNHVLHLPDLRGILPKHLPQECLKDFFVLDPQRRIQHGLFDLFAFGDGNGPCGIHY